MTSNNSTLNVAQVFGGAASTGEISPQTHALLTAPDLGQKIQAGLGVAADTFQSSEAFLVALELDDSGSIRFAGNSQVVRDGSNEVMKALRGSKSNSDILMLVDMLNRGKIRDAKGNPLGFCGIDQIPELDSNNYDANGGTPLYDKTIEILGTVLAKSEEFKLQGVQVRTATLIVTDGMDEGSRRGIAEARAIVTDMQKREMHIVAAMGIGDDPAQQALFRQVFTDMGIDPQWILTPSNSPTEIRRAFQVFSRSSVQASQGAASFSRVASLGFRTP